MDINSLPSYTLITSVLLPDGQWYSVKGESFMAEGSSFHFRGSLAGKIGSYEVHAPLSSLMALKAHPER